MTTAARTPAHDASTSIGAGLIEAMRTRVIVGDGAMGTSLQDFDLDLSDFEDHEGCNEILNVTRPDVVESIHESFYDVGCDLVESNTFGANLANLAEYGISDRIEELALAGAQIARRVADRWSTTERPRWVVGSMGPGTKLPSLGHAPFAVLRDAYQRQAGAMIEGGVDGILIETAQDLLQAKAAVIGSKRAIAAAGSDTAVIVQVTIEAAGTMLLGTEIGAALNALQPLGIHAIGLNCATGPTEMSEHLRHLSRHSTIPITCMPNAGLPVLSGNGASYPLTPAELADAMEQFVHEFGIGLVGGCCGTTPEHLRQVVQRVAGLVPTRPAPHVEPGVSSLYHFVPFKQDADLLAIGERTNANGSKVFREAMLEARVDDAVEIAREQIRTGAHLLDLCIDYVGRDGVDDMRVFAGRLATASTLPLVIDSTEPEVVEAGLEMLGGRSVVNSVNYEDGDGPTSRMSRIMPIIVEHGAAVVALTIDEEGQARTAEWKVRVAERLIVDLTENWGIAEDDILVDTLTFPIATGQEETRRDGIETIEAIKELKRLHPRVQTTLGLSNVSFGLSAATRVVLNSVFLAECVAAGLDSAIVHASKIVPVHRIPEEQRQAALDLVYDRRRYAADGTLEYDPLQRILELFEGVDVTSSRDERAAALAALPLNERLQARIVEGERTGLDEDLEAALLTSTALSIVNDTLLEGMRTVGELFGSGQMQLPFVLQSAEVMKAAVAYLEPHMERTDDAGKGTIVLATVKGDVHDIGKNLVDIILTNNGYSVVNLGIKQPVNAILEAADQHDADAIGMSGLLVKSTVVMRENLLEMNQRNVAERWPVLLGGAALTRSFVEHDLADMFDGHVRYARDAFEGLALMEAVMAVKRGDPGAVLPAPRDRRVRARSAGADPSTLETVAVSTERSDVATDNPVPTPPFWGDRVVRGIALADYASYLDERATFLGQWGLRASRGDEGPSYEELVETEGRPRLRQWLDRIHTDSLLEAAVAYGYFPCVSEGNDLVILDASGNERCRFTFPRQTRDRRLCLADYFKSRASGEVDVVAFQVVTMGQRVADATAELFAKDAYRDYLELHGLSVQLTEALAEMWHARVRSECGFANEDGDLAQMLNQGYRGSRYSFGYPACPNIEDQDKLMDLLDPERIGVSLSEEFQLHPEQSTSAIIVHHPEAKYFNAR